ncbi:MlaD family protein [Candidatus Eisenbacteria bacterium]|uniref:MlaD family protein n=1 Tax=Eiseniibacteriota bacterium TaxID=2212470 RepID=A0ABV6YP06_UNCEI
MSQKANPRLIGGFVVGAVALAVIVFLVFGSGKYFIKKNTYVVYFPSSVSGLAAGDPVKVKGITIGSVKRVKPLISPAGEFFAEVFVDVQVEAVSELSNTPDLLTTDEIMNDLFDRGLRAQLGVSSFITGKQYVNLDLYTGTKPVFMGFSDDYVEIPSVPTRTEEIQGTLEGFVEVIQDLDIKGLIESTKSLLASVDSLTRMSEFRVAAARLNEVLATTDTLFTNINAEMPEISASLKETSEAIILTAQRAEVLFERIDNVVAEEEMAFRETMNELEKAARAMRMLAEQLEEQPSSMIFGKDD